jgi:protoporphyrinogen oxidase
VNTDSEVLLLGYYGKSLYELFFKNYIYNVWGIYPKDFSSKFAEQRIPKISASIFLNRILLHKKVKFSKKTVKDFVENVDGELFTTKEGYRGITERIINYIKKNGVYFHLNSRVTGLDVKDDMIKKILLNSPLEPYNNKKTFINFDDLVGVVNTIPINELVLMINTNKLPEEIIEAAHGLHFRSIVFVGLLINKPKVLPVSFIYFREHSFNRIYDSSYFGHDTYTTDTTILVAEISSSGNDRWWEDEDYCRKMVLQDLLRENIISKHDVLEVHVYKYKYGYPIYTKGYEKKLGSILSYINKIKNLQTAGRQGLFQYINGHIAIQTGFDAAEEIIKSIECNQDY